VIARYSRPAMARIWSDEGKLARWLEVELAALEGWAEVGAIPANVVSDIRERAAVPSPARVGELEARLHHDTAAFVDAVAEHLGPVGRWFHYGLTSSDVVDTALALQVQEAGALVRDGLDRALAAVVARADEHRLTLCIGRTHGVHAEPTTLGLKLAVWAFELDRARTRVARALEGMRFGKLSGAVGQYAAIDPDVERVACERLGLEPAPASTQIIQRDRHAELLAALAVCASSLDKFAIEVRHLARTEVREVEEPFGKGQKGSSAMPHKRNPIGSEQIVGLARLVRANAMAAFENVALWHERDISHSSVERVILPDSFIALDHMLKRLAKIVAGMVVYPDRMLENLSRSRGVVFSGSVLLELARRGVSREQAYEWVQRNAMRSFSDQRDFKQLLLADSDVTGVLPAAVIEECFSLDAQMRNVDAIFARVFGAQTERMSEAK
jgi:adenylosuccinate lyase